MEPDSFGNRTMAAIENSFAQGSFPKAQSMSFGEQSPSQGPGSETW